jgi:hypothetical protein
VELAKQPDGQYAAEGRWSVPSRCNSTCGARRMVFGPAHAAAETCRAIADVEALADGVALSLLPADGEGIVRCYRPRAFCSRWLEEREATCGPRGGDCFVPSGAQQRVWFDHMLRRFVSPSARLHW